WLVIADVEIQTNANRYPLRYDGRLCFPVGRFRTVLPQPELQAALSAGDIVNVYAACVYDGANIFADYVDYFYDKRMMFEAEGNKAFSFMFKIMLNSLYGKFGQSGRVYETIGLAVSPLPRSWTEYDAVSKTTEHYREFAGIRQRLSETVESGESHP